MTGGGFGGCTVNLVHRDDVEAFTNFISNEYRARTAIQPDIYAVNPDNGVKEIYGYAGD